MKRIKQNFIENKLLEKQSCRILELKFTNQDITNIY